MARVPRELFVKKDKWKTLETHWSSAKIRFYFRLPSGAKIRVRYGFGWFSKNRQKQTLDGLNTKIISIGFWGVTRAKIQIKTTIDSLIFYEAEAIGP